MTSKEWKAEIHGELSDRMVPYEIIIHPEDDIIADLAASERSDVIHLEALAESEAAGQKAEQEREHFWEMREGMRERAEKAEAREAALVAALGWAMHRLTPYTHASICTPTLCSCGYDKAHAALAAKETP